MGWPVIRCAVSRERPCDWPRAAVSEVGAHRTQTADHACPSELQPSQPCREAEALPGSGTKGALTGPCAPSGSCTAERRRGMGGGQQASSSPLPRASSLLALQPWGEAGGACRRVSFLMATGTEEDRQPWRAERGGSKGPRRLPGPLVIRPLGLRTGGWQGQGAVGSAGPGLSPSASGNTTQAPEGPGGPAHRGPNQGAACWPPRAWPEADPLLPASPMVCLSHPPRGDKTGVRGVRT